MCVCVTKDVANRWTIKVLLFRQLYAGIENQAQFFRFLAILSHPFLKNRLKNITDTDIFINVLGLTIT